MLEIQRTKEEEIHIVAGWADDQSIENWIGVSDWHAYWSTLKANPDWYFFSVFSDGDLVGLVWGERDNEGVLTIALIVRPDLQRQGLGQSTLRLLVQNVREILPEGIRSIEAHIFPQNAVSIRCFAGAGFQFAGEGEDGDLVYRYDL